MQGSGAFRVEPTPGEASFAQIERRLQAAVRAEAYDEIPELLAEHNHCFEQAMSRVSGDTEETRRLANRVHQMLDWVKVSVLAHRAHAEASLSRLANAARYMPAQGRAGRTWKFEA